jgi:hypothetical protein
MTTSIAAGFWEIISAGMIRRSGKSLRLFGNGRLFVKKAIRGFR